MTLSYELHFCRLGRLRDVAGGRGATARVRYRWRLLRLRDGHHRDRDREHAGANATSRSGKAGLRGRAYQFGAFFIDLMNLAVLTFFLSLGLQAGDEHGGW
jgi:hypothetical protein